MLQNCGRWTSKEADQKSQRWREPESCPEAAAVRLPGGAGRPAGAAPRLRGASGSVLRQWRDVRQRREQLIVRSEIAYNNHLDNLVTDGVNSISPCELEMRWNDLMMRRWLSEPRCGIEDATSFSMSLTQLPNLVGLLAGPTRVHGAYCLVMINIVLCADNRVFSAVEN